MTSRNIWLVSRHGPPGPHVQRGIAARVSLATETGAMMPDTAPEPPVGRRPTLRSPWRTVVSLLALMIGLVPHPAAPAPVSPPAAAPPPASAPVPGPIALRYVLYSHSLHLLDAEATLRLDPDGYAITLHDRTTGLAGLLLHADVSTAVSGRFDGATPEPVAFASSGVSRGAARAVRIVYPGGEPKVLELRPTDHDRDPVVPSDTLHSVDALSAMAGLVRLVARTGGCDGEARIFDGLRLSVVSVHTAGPDPVPTGTRSSYAGPALRCDFTSRQIGGFLHNADEARARLPQHGSAWLAAPYPGAPALPVRVVFDNPHFGTATLSLTEATPTATSATPPPATTPPGG